MRIDRPAEIVGRLGGGHLAQAARGSSQCGQPARTVPGAFACPGGLYEDASPLSAVAGRSSQGDVPQETCSDRQLGDTIQPPRSQAAFQARVKERSSHANQGGKDARR